MSDSHVTTKFVLGLNITHEYLLKDLSYDDLISILKIRWAAGHRLIIEANDGSDTDDDDDDHDDQFTSVCITWTRMLGLAHEDKLPRKYLQLWSNHTITLSKDKHLF